MQKKPYKLGIIVGRFQTLHKGHEMMVNRCIELSEKTGIFVGSSNESGTNKNPFTYDFRREILLSVFGKDVNIYPLPDIGVGNVPIWGEYVLKNVAERFGEYPDLLVSGKESRRIDWFDASSFDVSELYVPKYIDISATEMREFLINGDIESWKQYTPEPVWNKYNIMRDIVINCKDNHSTKSV